ncbi:MAG: SusD/RagB family nutrient-binding outer membrane lipoprotein [Bacteroidota bacterium]
MKKLILIALLVGITVSCEDFEGWNVDTKKPSEVPSAYLFSNAEKSLFDYMTSTNVNDNIFKMYAQYWTETTYNDEANYDLKNRNIGGNFSSEMYRNVLMNLEDAKRAIGEDEFTDAGTKANQTALANLLQIFTYHVLVDTYGYKPYTEALDVTNNIVPIYDSGSSIYTDLFARLDGVIALLSEGGASFGSADLVYHGDVSKWVKFANSLKLRMAVRIADVDNGTASSKASEAVADGVFMSKSDNAAFPYEAGNPTNSNPLWKDLVQSGRKDFVVTNTFVDLISPLNDPRSPIFMADNFDPYIGGPYGDNNPYSDFTHIGDIFHTEDFEAILISYSEVEFLLAEAVERGLISGSASEHYANGVKASMDYWGVSEVDADSYLAAQAYDSGNWKESIGIQKYISLYGRGFEAWSTWRLLDYPEMNRPVVSELPVPRRYIYGNFEGEVNGENYDAAASAMGGDNLDSRVFWDVVGQGN